LIYAGLVLFDSGLAASFNPFFGTPFGLFGFISLIIGGSLAALVAIFGIFHLGDILGDVMESWLKFTWKLRYSDW
jgi:hypothetical protein